MSYPFKEFAKVGIISETGSCNIGKMTESFRSGEAGGDSPEPGAGRPWQNPD
jgi:hypothetical protein